MQKRTALLSLLFAVLLPLSAQKMTVGSCTLKDGGIYTGELVGGKPNGKGRAQY